MSGGRLNDIDFERRNPLVMFILFVLLYGLFFGSALYIGLQDIVNHASEWTGWLEAGFILIVYLLGALLLLFYAIFSPYRFAFKEEGISVMTWRGRRFYRWGDIRKASLTSHKGSVDLVLHAGSLRYITVPLFAFKKSATLFTEIRQRLPIPVAASERHLSLISDR
jgi:hypothetical protein